MSVQAEIEKYLQPILKEHELELVELNLTRGKKSRVQVYVWKQDGVLIDLCTKVSRQLADVLDRKDLIPGAYRLEVSSPGLDRPLKTKRDFEQRMGEKIKIERKVNDKTQRIRGLIHQIGDTSVTLQADDEDYEVVPFSEIILAKIIIEI
ncbi:MAG: ribosome maturation factor RimP [candidate division KSB1 bacterium]|nr:ribosome maturation factor RimP [candidate division KSB1 bacterium]